MDIEAFIARWTGREGGAERANYVMFLTELCDVLGIVRPDPAGASSQYNDYVFERSVRPRESAELGAPQRIDLYKKGCFVLEAKQSRLPGKRNAIPGQAALALPEPEQLGRRGIVKGWDVMMQNARQQGERYVFMLDPSQPAPPFLIVCDVGHCLELYADFSGTGRAYGQFPDRKGFRIYLEDLRQAEVRDRLKQVWTDPQALDPARHAAAVTRAIAKRLAEVSKRLEARGCNAEDVAHFLMRCLFTMFAEDAGLLPEDSFKTLLQESIADPAHFARRLKDLWAQMDAGEEYSHVIRARVRRFNGGLFRNTTAFELDREEIGELLAAAKHRWTDVDPAIFGTLLEQALNKDERRRLGAHYTPRAYVQRLVEVTIMEPLRADWQAALIRAEQAKEDGDEGTAVAAVRAFHHQLCATRVLDPACGTGNFLYVALELMKKLEGEVLETLAQLGEPESMGLDREAVDPHQFLGLEINPRAAAIAELVIWIGYLQQHYRTRTGHPSDPILRDFRNINRGQRGGYDAVLDWDGYPVPKIAVRNGTRVETYPNARQPVWPEAEFIVGNPPFIAGQDIRSERGAAYAEQLWKTYSDMNASADFVMYWWDRAAGTLTKKPQPALRRFGLVTTNSISQVFQRRTVARWLTAKRPLSIIWAVDNHPWTKASKDTAAVRIAMTVASAGTLEGKLLQIKDEHSIDGDTPSFEFTLTYGKINSDLTVGTDITRCKKLRSNEGIAHDGVKLHGKGFVIQPQVLKSVGLGVRPGLEDYVKFLSNGRDERKSSRRLVLDFFGVSHKELMDKFPEAYQFLTQTVRYDLDASGKPKEDSSGRKIGREWNRRKTYRENWWIFGEPRAELRPALNGLSRYIGTVDTSPNRVFTFFDKTTLVDDAIVVIASDSSSVLALLSSRFHVAFATRAGGWLGVGDDPRYNKSLVFDPFPFPGSELSELAPPGLQLDTHRKRVLAEHPDLTLTGLYNVLEKLKAGAPLTDKDEDVKDRGLVLVLKEIHAEIDRLTAKAYGWAVDLADADILARLVALNAERAREEAAGHVRWLRPDYQVPRLGRQVAATTAELDLGATVVALEAALPAFPTDPLEAPLAVERILAGADAPLSAPDIARRFRRGGKRVEQKVAKSLTTLVRYGRVFADGDKFIVRRSHAA